MNDQSPVTRPRFCTHCGTPLLEDGRFCTKCGAPVTVVQPAPKPEVTPAPVPAPKAPAVKPTKPQRKGNFFKKNRTACILVSVFLLSIVITVLTWFSSQYIGLITATNQQNAIRALQFYEKLPAVCPIPKKAADFLSPVLYECGLASYEADDLTEAKRYFTDVKDYEISEVYLLLIDCRMEKSLSAEEKERLMELMGVADVGQFILENDDLVWEFLQGRWEQLKSYDPRYFELKQEDGAYVIYHNLPAIDPSADFYFSNGTYYSKTPNGDIEEFTFTFISEDAISVYCHYNKDTYTLRRK